MEFGLNGTIYAIFVIRQMQEKFRMKRKKHYFGFVNLEKVYDMVRIEVMRWVVCTLCAGTWLLSATFSVSMCKNSC